VKELVAPILLALAVCAAGPALAAEMSITAPEAGAVVSGAIEVRATVVAEEGEDLEPPMLQTLDGHRIPLAGMGGGVYAAEVDTTVLPNGRQTIMVYVTRTGVDARREEYADSSWAGDKYATVAEVPILVRNPYQLYWGDIHAHTSYSDGGWYPGEAYAYARDEAKLDFLAITDHLEILTLDEYGDVMARANEADEPGRFVALYGVERTAADGHINVYMSPTHILPSDLGDFYRAVALRGLVGHFNHPRPVPAEGADRRNDFQGFHYDPVADASMAMVELRDEREETCYIALLDNGWHVGAAGDEDKHDATWGGGPTWTVALARGLTRESILDAFRSRRTYSTADRNLRLTFTLDGEDMGSRLARPAGGYLCEVALQDPDPDHLIARVDLFLDGEIVRSAQPDGTTFSWRETLEFPPGRHYCFLRVTQNDQRMTWSSPIWVSAH
jgi:hypothetical protein